jgi:hypothetical protein
MTVAARCKNVFYVTLRPFQLPGMVKIYVGIGISRPNDILKLHSTSACFTMSREDLKGLLDQFF